MPLHIDLYHYKLWKLKFEEKVFQNYILSVFCKYGYNLYKISKSSELNLGETENEFLKHLLCQSHDKHFSFSAQNHHRKQYLQMSTLNLKKDSEFAKMNG